MTTLGLRSNGFFSPARGLLAAALACAALWLAINGGIFTGERPAAPAVPTFKGAAGEDELQRRLGWHAALSVSDMEPRVVTLLLLDRDGAPLRAEAVAGQLRGFDPDDDRLLAFTPAGPSLWRAPLGDAAHGETLRIEATRPDGPAYRAEWRLPLR